MWAIIWFRRWPALFGALGIATFLLSMAFRDFGQFPIILILLGMAGEGVKRQDRREARLLDRVARADLEGALVRRRITVASAAASALTAASFMTLMASYFRLVTIDLVIAAACVAGMILAAAIMMFVEWRTSR